MQIIDNIEQGSEEWFALRVGRPTASKFSIIITASGAASTSRKKYLHQLVAERLLGMKEETFQSAAMSRGVELEPEARALYEMIQDVTVRQVAMCLSDDGRYGCSPDGLLDGGGLEIKCPGAGVHIGYRESGVVPTEYYQQVQGSMLVTGYEYWDFVSYYPGIKPLIYRERRNEPYLAKLKSELDRFCDDLNELTERLK